MDVFVSWSGKRSKALAGAIAKWLRTVHHHLRPWMSDRDLRKGDRWLAVIGDRLSKHQVGLVCVTPENAGSAWLLFEAGALSKTLGQSRVCPVLLGMQPSELDGPLAQFQATTFCKDEMLDLLLSLNSHLGDRQLEPDIVATSFAKFWPDLEEDVAAISRLGIPSSSLRSVVDALQHRGFPQPAVGRVVCFEEGFESHSLYDIALAEARNRLYVFGRKNRKLFDKEHCSSVEELSGRVSKGLDFRCLFLDPESPEHVLAEEHTDGDFPEQLRGCVSNALRRLRDCGVDPSAVCRAYRNHRQHAMVVVDSAVMFAPVERAGSGKARRLTKCRFEIVDADSPVGIELLREFDSTWEQAAPLIDAEEGGESAMGD